MKRLSQVVAICIATIVVAVLVHYWNKSSKTDSRSVLKCTTAASYTIPDREIEMRRHESIIIRLKSEHPKVIFFGDSLTQRWETEGKTAWKDHIVRFHAGNAGVDNDRTENLLWRIDKGLEGVTPPEICVVLIGINNLGADGDTPIGIAAGVETVAKNLLRKFPDTRVVILGLLPSGPYSHGFLGRRSRTNRKISSIQLPKVHFHDISKAFLNKDGGLRNELSTDGIHLSELGYQTLAYQLVPILENYHDLSN